MASGLTEAAIVFAYGFCVLLAAFYAAVAAIAYYHLRVEKEGIAVEDIVVVFG